MLTMKVTNDNELKAYDTLLDMLKGLRTCKVYQNGMIEIGNIGLNDDNKYTFDIHIGEHNSTDLECQVVDLHTTYSKILELNNKFDSTMIPSYAVCLMLKSESQFLLTSTYNAIMHSINPEDMMADNIYCSSIYNTSNGWYLAYFAFGSVDESLNIDPLVLYIDWDNY